jgi:hypothetical protein
MKYFLKHINSGLLVKAHSAYGCCVDPMEADKFPSPEMAIAKSPLPVDHYTVCLYKPPAKHPAYEGTF